VRARQRADLAELADWVEGLRAAAQKARDDLNFALAEALDITRFEVYEGYLDEELHQSANQAGDQRSPNTFQSPWRSARYAKLPPRAMSRRRSLGAGCLLD
jgi:hypothetical protein